MKREQVVELLDNNFDIIKDGIPIKIEGDIWSYLDMLDEEENSVFVLVDILKWTDEELKNIQYSPASL